MSADPTLAAATLLDHLPKAARSIAAARADADHCRTGLQWAAGGVALILIKQSRLLSRVGATLMTTPGRGLLASLPCALLLAALVAAARMLGGALADAVWSSGALGSDFTRAVLNLPVEALVGGLILWAMIGARRQWPRLGWIGMSAAAAGLIFAAVLIPPLTLLPWGRGDHPASGGDTAPILAFVRTGGLDARTLYVFDSSDPFAVDMEGVGPFAHASVSRAALAAPQPETYAAIGHLLGHHHHHDLLWLAALWSVVVAAFCWTVWICCGILERRSVDVASASSLDAQASPVVGLIGWGLLLLATPTFNLFDQAINYRADDYALSLTHDPDALCRWLMRDDGGKADPSMLESLLFYDHPPLKARLVNVMTWSVGRGGR